MQSIHIKDNHEELVKEYRHLIGSLIEFTNQATAEKVYGLIVGFYARDSITGLHNYTCLSIEMFGDKGIYLIPTLSEFLANKAYKVIS